MAKSRSVNAQMEQLILSSIRATMSCMLEDGLHADLKIQSQNDLTLVHRSVLSGMSPVFKAMFSAEQADVGGQNIVKLKDIVTTKALRGFLRLLYVGVLDSESVSWEHVLEMLAASHTYEIPLAKAACASALRGMLTVDNCLRILEYGDMYDAALMNVCKKFVSKHFKQVVFTDGFEDLANRKPALLVNLVRSKMECTAPKKIARYVLIPFVWSLRR